MLDAIIDDRQHPGMESERSCHQPVDARMLSGRVSSKARNIFRPVAARRQEVGKHNDLSGTSSDTTIEGLSNRRFRKFHMRWLDNRKLRLRGKSSSRFVQHLIAFTTTRSMINNDDANNREHEDLERF
jgi:hypothetical protein